MVRALVQASAQAMRATPTRGAPWAALAFAAALVAAAPSLAQTQGQTQGQTQAPAPAQAGAASAAPGFWDPRRRPERPDLSRLTLIRFMTEVDYPPFDFAGPDGNPTGFNVDLARADVRGAARCRLHHADATLRYAFRFAQRGDRGEPRRSPRSR